jgi:protein tyrosine phosphatase (PTP) superfamily phosphohydrolase (DUF442 family)
MIDVMLRTLALLVLGSCTGSLLFAQNGAPKEAVLPETRPASEARYTILGDKPGVKAVVKYSDRLYRGAQPQSVEGMLELKKLGVSTILSVEEPEQEELDHAREAGLVVVNIPTEYNGIPADVANTIVAKYRSLEGTVYAHCHHGKHRGGAASAILRMTFEGIPQLEAIQELAELGCSKRYPGLYESMRKYRPDPAIAHRVLKERAGIQGLIEVTPWILRGTSDLGPEAIAGLKELGVRSVLSAGMSPEVQDRVRAAGMNVVVLPVTIESADANERRAVVRALSERKREKVFLHSAKDPAQVAAMVAFFRIGLSLWTSDEAAREVEALVPGDGGAKVARSVRAIVDPKSL